MPSSLSSYRSSTPPRNTQSRLPCRDTYIHPVPDSEWALGKQPAVIYARRRQMRLPQYLVKSVVILDEQTARDKSVLVVMPILMEDGIYVKHGVRFDARKAVANLGISNRGLEIDHPSQLSMAI
ncbi:hypothetical protein DFH11DRAFT_1548427 [Phellopilus nigrolimitatus]|nr:hypothetical protein DFH11DRAFT_1548427 [Phellopilus nigrolimitatus]